MKDIHFKPYLVFVIAFALTAHASERSEHTGYWKRYTPKGNEFKCERVATEERMVEVLRSAGWDVNDEIPEIIWERDKAVIVAPSAYYESHHLKFDSLTREGNSIVLKYEWEPIREHRERRPPSRPGSVSIGIGSASPGYPATIVVSYKIGLDSNREFVCRNIGLMQ